MLVISLIVYKCLFFKKRWRTLIVFYHILTNAFGYNLHLGRSFFVTSYSNYRKTLYDKFQHWKKNHIGEWSVEKAACYTIYKEIIQLFLCKSGVVVLPKYAVLNFRFSNYPNIKENCIYYDIWFLTVCYYHVTYDFQSESTIYNLPECQGTPCSKQARYLKFKWQQRDSNPQPLSS